LRRYSEEIHSIFPIFSLFFLSLVLLDPQYRRVATGIRQSAKDWIRHFLIPAFDLNVHRWRSIHPSTNSILRFLPEPLSAQNFVPGNIRPNRLFSRRCRIKWMSCVTNVFQQPLRAEMFIAQLQNTNRIHAFTYMHPSGNATYCVTFSAD